MSGGIDTADSTNNMGVETLTDLELKTAYGKLKTDIRKYKIIIAVLSILLISSTSFMIYNSLTGIPSSVAPPPPNIATPSSTIASSNVIIPSTDAAAPPNFQLLNGSKISNNATMWVFYETESKEYVWDKDNMPQLSVILYGTVRTTLDQNVETTMTGPINSDVYPAMTTTKPISSAISKSEFPKVSSFKQIIVMDKKQWPYDGTYMLQGKHGGIKSWQIFFKIKPPLMSK